MSAPSNLPNERWLPVIGGGGKYDVSDTGRVRNARATSCIGP